MIDYFALALTHGLLLIALLRLVGRADVDADPDVLPEAQVEEQPVETRREARERRRRRDA